MVVELTNVRSCNVKNIHPFENRYHTLAVDNFHLNRKAGQLCPLHVFRPYENSTTNRPSVILDIENAP